MLDQFATSHQLRVFLYIIKKNKWKIVAVLLATVIIVAVGSLIVKPIYRASAKLLVKPGREDIYVSPTGASPAMFDPSAGSEKVRTEIAIINSLDLVRELVDSVGVDRLFDYPTLRGRFFEENSKPNIPSLQKVYRTIQERLDVTAISKSSVIDIAFEWPDPMIAAEVVNILVDLYLVKHLEVYTDSRTYELLDEQSKKWERKLRASEKNLEDFKRLHSLNSLSEERSLLLARLSALEAARAYTASEIEETFSMITALKAQLSNLKKHVTLQERVNSDSETLANLKAKLLELELQGLKEDIDQVETMIDKEKKGSEVVSGTSPIAQTLQSDLITARARLKSLKAKARNQELQIAKYQEGLNRFVDLEKEMKELARKGAIDETNYKLYLTKFEESKISANMDKERIANVSVIELAVPNPRPVKPKMMLNLFLGCFLGLVAGVNIVFFTEFINPVFRNREDVQQFLGLSVLATLPKVKQSQASAEYQKLQVSKPEHAPSKYSKALLKAENQLAVEGEQKAAAKINLISSLADPMRISVKETPSSSHNLYKFVGERDE